MGIANEMPNNAKLCEVGVADGKSAVFLAEALLNQGKKFQLCLVDNLDYGKTDQLKTILTNIYKSGLSEFIDTRGLGLGSLDSSCKFPDQYFNFVFIDSSHTYEQTKAEVRLWHRKVLPNCILAGHDAIPGENPEVITALDELVQPGFMTIHETSKGYGVWEIRMSNGFKPL
jgi:cephalosporin hydroxylase